MLVAHRSFRFLPLFLVVAVIGGPNGVSPVRAEPPDISLSGRTLTFIPGSAVAYGDLLSGSFDYIEPVVSDVDFDNDSTLDCLRARLSAVSRTPNGNIEIDSASTDWIDPFIDDTASNRPPGVESSAIVTLEFLFDSGCDNTDVVPAIVTDVCINVKDIDEGQFAQFKNPDRYTLLANSELSTTHESEGFVRATESGLVSVPEEDSNEEAYWFQVEYDRTSSVTFGVGIGDKATTDLEAAIFDVIFECATWTGETVERVPSSGFSAPDIDLDHFLERAADAEGALPNTK